MKNKLPQFLLISFDDFPIDTKGMDFVLKNNPDNKFTFFICGGKVKDKRLEYLYKNGHEIANHTFTHSNGKNFLLNRWMEEIELCNRFLAENSCGKPIGFRAPYLSCNNRMISALVKSNFTYDASYIRGFQECFNGTDYEWPRKSKEGLWMVYNYPLIFKDRERQLTTKITCFDWNLIFKYLMKPEQILESLKHTLNLRLSGNKSPMIFAAHSQLYSNSKELREMLSSFIDYASDKGVCITTYSDMISRIHEVS